MILLSVSVFHAIGACIITGIICLVVGYKLKSSKDAAKIDATVKNIKDKV